MMKISIADYRKKLRGCFVGKAVGGTLGMPMEGHLTPKPFTFYDPVPTGMVANDDLDLQVVWLECLRQYGLPVNRHHLALAWLDHVRCAPDEYGAALRNLTAGVFPPLSGRRENHFTDGMGAAIRSEIWAALAPGDPDLAVRLCREDAVVDHDGNGVDACAFLTAVESAAYVESDRDALVAAGLRHITPEGRLARALRDVQKWYRETPDFLQVRQRLIDAYAVQNWTDVTMNLALILLAWMAGGGDFSRSICIAAEMGYDADCTCATLGSILGMLDPDGIEPRWTAPLGDALVLSNCMVAMHPVATIRALCGQIEAMSARVQAFYDAAVRFDGEAAADPDAAEPWAPRDVVSLADGYDPRESLLLVQPYVVSALADGDGDLAPGVARGFTLRVTNPNGAVTGTLRLTAPHGWAVEPRTFTLTDAPVRFAVTPPDDSCRARSFLTLAFDTGALRFSASMGLPQTMPWTMDGVRHEGGFTTAFPAGAHTFAIDVIVPYAVENAALICEGTRPLRVEVDGVEVLAHAAEQFVPAVHRSGHRAILALGGGSHTVTVRLADGGAGEFCFGLADPRSWIWFPDLTYTASR